METNTSNAIKARGTKEALESFMASDMKIAKVSCKTYKAAHNEFNLFTYRVKKAYSGAVKVHQRGTDIYLEKLS